MQESQKKCDVQNNRKSPFFECVASQNSTPKVHYDFNGSGSNIGHELEKEFSGLLPNEEKIDDTQVSTDKGGPQTKTFDCKVMSFGWRWVVETQ